MHRVTWYFDFISPYSYFGLGRLDRLPPGTLIEYQPVLLAGLLSHWGQKGPAEMPSKRLWTYRACVWWAKQNEVPFRMPATHPFNPLSFLRLAIAAGNSKQAIQTIFKALWTTGADPADPRVMVELAKSLNVSPERIADPQVKTSLRAATEQAVARGVFGVPTFYINGQLFWGNDATDFAAAYLVDPGMLTAEEFKRADTTPVGVSRS